MLQPSQPTATADELASNCVAQTAAVVRELVAAQGFKEIRKATAIEWWAHCRPHHMGHQLHFDSGMGVDVQGAG